ncbi:MAG: hypothetical protein ABSB59_05585 [Streptosporangiaceae bacterium]
MTAATLVRPALWLTFPAVRAAAHALWTAPRLRERYPAYLAVMHGLIRASVPLMETAAERCRLLPPEDPSAGPLAGYFGIHAEEERGHDDWLLEDLAVLGVRTPDALLADAPLAVAGPGGDLRDDIAALAGAQYYLIRHCHPACLLGYIAVLEGCPPDAAVTSRLPALTGWPAAAFRTVAEHAALDPGHQRDLDALLDVLTLRPAVTAAVARNVAFTADRAASLLYRLAGPPGGTASRGTS